MKTKKEKKIGKPGKPGKKQKLGRGRRLARDMWQRWDAPGGALLMHKVCPLTGSPINQGGN